jgi:hypothetical protein
MLNIYLSDIFAPCQGDFDFTKGRKEGETLKAWLVPLITKGKGKNFYLQTLNINNNTSKGECREPGGFDPETSQGTEIDFKSRR